MLRTISFVGLTGWLVEVFDFDLYGSLRYYVIMDGDYRRNFCFVLSYAAELRNVSSLGTVIKDHASMKSTYFPRFLTTSPLSRCCPLLSAPTWCAGIFYVSQQVKNSWNGIQVSQKPEKLLRETQARYIFTPFFASQGCT